jgi:hypothetical protein
VVLRVPSAKLPSIEHMFAAGTEPSDAAELPLERLEHEITELAAHINAGSCRWLELIAEFDRREGWGSWGCRSCAEWVAWQCAVTSRAAREHVRVARRLEELPRIHKEFAEGRLSYSKVRALTRVAEPDSEEDLLELATHATAAQLERVVRGLRRVSAAEADERNAERYLVTWWEDDGSLSVWGQLPAEDAAVFLKALDASHDRLRESAAVQGSGSAEPHEAAGGGSAEPPLHPRQTHADALVVMATSSISASNPGVPHARLASTRRLASDAYQVTVHVDAATLSRDARGQVRIADGPALASETVRRLACDSSLVPIIESEGEALTVGRKTRAVPPAVRRAVEARDGGCRFPGCERRRFLDAHHIHHWAHGGETSKENLVMLCRHHHRLVHEGGVRLKGDAKEQVRFRLRDGTVLTSAPPSPPGSASALRRLNAGSKISIDADTCLSGSGERMDLGYTVSVVAARQPRARQPQ